MAVAPVEHHVCKVPEHESVVANFDGENKSGGAVRKIESPWALKFRRDKSSEVLPIHNVIGTACPGWFRGLDHVAIANCAGRHRQPRSFTYDNRTAMVPDGLLFSL